MTKSMHYGVAVLFALSGFALAAVGLKPIFADLLILSAYYLLLAGSWNLLAGFAGQYSFAHIGLAAAGAYATAAMVNWAGLPGWTAFLAVPVFTAIVGGVLGLVALRVRGVQLPLITFAFAGAFAVFLAAAADITGGSMGMQLPKLFAGFDRSPYLVLAGLLTGLFFLVQNLVLDGRLGLLMQSVRDDEEVARGIGVDIFRVKITAFVITAALAGLAGAFYANYVGVLAPTMLSMSEMGMVVAMAVIGGLGHRYGALAGVLVIRTLEHFVRGFGAEYTLVIITGVALVVVLFFREGIIAAFGKRLDRAAQQKRWAGSGAH
ncbi:branched-chain amino acid ABC transporter permease [Mesorhizobium sp. SP-1A]|uniref:branched-chain amino acid ABC transporter permease n=1 Tax=Mesorhizobium sp. SP-1A TaxID=3077840 RepID=UPI0028F6DB97|nr:branched-chain amino acid ABC transporter permease [Mesorhizobium sp. SP-1A]